MFSAVDVREQKLDGKEGDSSFMYKKTHPSAYVGCRKNKKGEKGKRTGDSC